MRSYRDVSKTIGAADVAQLIIACVRLLKYPCLPINRLLILPRALIYYVQYRSRYLSLLLFSRIHYHSIQYWYNIVGMQWFSPWTIVVDTFGRYLIRLPSWTGLTGWTLEVRIIICNIVIKSTEKWSPRKNDKIGIYKNNASVLLKIFKTYSSNIHIQTIGPTSKNPKAN